jgi:hypothetical protein
MGRGTVDFYGVEPYSYLSVTSFVFSGSTTDDAIATKKLLAGDAVYIIQCSGR